MMLLNELTLRRFRNHENLTVRLQAGVTGIIGRNGTGKSSIIEAIGFLFTGEADDPKSEVITAGSSGTSYVRGKFTLNGKEGAIERALDTSRVHLEYDGQKLVKAGEVKELWAKLLQIDSHIFQHVIMAKQKKIPELFSGEAAVRERAFQRIFMVPNTERLRSLIWEGYIKTCPPLLPEDDLYAIDTEIAKLIHELGPKQEKLSIISTSVLSEPQMMAVINYTDYYGRCMQDAEKRPLLEQQLSAKRKEVEELTGQLERISASLASWPSDLQAQHDALLTNDVKYRAYLGYCVARHDAETQLLNLHANPDLLKSELAALEQSYANARTRVAELNGRYSSLIKEIDSLQGLSGAPACPTCHQQLNDLPGHLLEARVNLSNLQVERAAAEVALQASQQPLLAKQRVLRQWEDLSIRKDLMAAQEAGSKVDHDEKALEAVGLLISCQKADELRHSQTSQLKVQAEACVAVLEEQLRHLVTYSGNASPAEELTLMQDVLARHRLRIQEINLLEREVSRLHTEIHILASRRKTSEANHEKNLAKTEYVNKLRMAYDALHTSQFPRKLVQTYSAVVEEELQQQLQRFDLPYAARIDDDFRIIVTKDGHTIPRLSGGQEMVVGLCLRLALHSMFSQAFPMLIIDEGTTHLDEENKKLYFQCITDLKADKVIQQLIIIDHSSLLTDAVDNVIRLT